MSKGLEMPVSLLVIIAIAVIILVGVVMLIGPQMGALGGGINMEAAKTKHCGAYVRQGCVDTVGSATVTTGYTCDPTGTLTVVPPVDADGDGKADTLYDLMNAYAGVTSASDCKKSCGCPGY